MQTSVGQTQKALDLTRLQLRSKIDIVAPAIHSGISEGEPITCHIPVHNYGNVTAHIRGYLVSCCFDDSSIGRHTLWEDIKSIPLNTTDSRVMPTGQYVIQVDSNQIPNRSHVDSIDAGIIKLYLFIRIAFTDALGTDEEFQTFYTYNHEERRFYAGDVVENDSQE